MWGGGIGILSEPATFGGLAFFGDGSFRNLSAAAAAIFGHYFRGVVNRESLRYGEIKENAD